MIVELDDKAADRRGDFYGTLNGRKGSAQGLATWQFLGWTWGEQACYLNGRLLEEKWEVGQYKWAGDSHYHLGIGEGKGGDGGRGCDGGYWRDGIGWNWVGSILWFGRGLLASRNIIYCQRSR